MKLLLDTGVLGEFCHPNTAKYRPKIHQFLNQVAQGNLGVFIPEIADYELRRELLRFARQNRQTTSKSLERLDNLVSVHGFEYLPITTPMWRQAAELWAEARNHFWSPEFIPLPLESGIHSVAVGVRNSFRSRWSPEFIPLFEAK